MNAEFRDLLSVARAINSAILGTSGSTTVSVRLPDNHIFAVVGRKDPFIYEEDVVEMLLDGTVLRGEPGEELMIHLDIYREWERVNALIHSYPGSLVNLALGRVPLAENVDPNMIFQKLQVVGSPPVDPEDWIEQIRNIFEVGVALITDGFGLLLAGEDLWEAFFRLQQLEELAERVTWRSVVNH
ncbi:class II aldolase/adducin family protein [Coprothermobacteraceae bacterium]|nr:class II aldolase/adducin family protein [Coprothermobacteraceae bacterium]